MQIKAQLKRYNQISKEMDTIYHNYAKSIGMSDTTFWMFYCISEYEESLTQRDLCKYWSFPPQTVNSALKDMERRGYITLEAIYGNKKNKYIRLTDEGHKLVEDVIFPLIEAEGESFSVFSEEECEQMLSLKERYTAELRSRIEGITKTDLH